MITTWKKILVAAVLLSFVLNVTGLAMYSPPQKVQAAWPTSEVLSVPTFIQIMKDLAQWIKTELLKALRDAVVKSIIAKIQNDIIQQITGGNGGDSSFVSNWGSYLKDDIINSAFNEFNDILANDAGIDLCVPFSQQFLSVRLNALTASYGVGQDYLGLPVRCTFDQFKNNLESTYNFITDGGWASYDALFSPSVNPYWIAWQVEDKFAQTVAEQKDAKKSEAESSGGFLGLKECSDPNAEEKARKQVESYCSQAPDDETRDACIEERLTQETINRFCTSWSVKTPGQAVSEAVTISLGADFEYAENVQSAISAIVNVLVSKALSEGLQSVSGGGTTVSRESGDLGGTGFEDYEDQTYQQDLEDAYRDYDDIIYYLTNDLGPVSAQTLALARDINGRDLESCPNTRISIDDGSGTKKIYTISEIMDLLDSFNLGEPTSAASRALAQARANQSEIEILLDQDNPKGTDVSKAMNKLQTFVRTYQPFYTDTQLVNQGSDGELVTLVWNINRALRSLNVSDLICL